MTRAKFELLMLLGYLTIVNCVTLYYCCKSLSAIASPVTPVSPWYDLAMSLDSHLLPCCMFKCALESVIDGD